ncbi:hypothetical protein K0651_12900 [Ornithinimicrobium sp. Arc0846-15]|nr:hypothetical protein [Ornithinimicrobium laminariae]
MPRQTHRLRKRGTRPRHPLQIAAIGNVDVALTDHVSRKSHFERSILARMLRHVRRDDTVRVFSMDRLAR